MARSEQGSRSSLRLSARAIRGSNRRSSRLSTSLEQKRQLTSRRAQSISNKVRFISSWRSRDHPGAKFPGRVRTKRRTARPVIAEKAILNMTSTTRARSSISPMLFRPLAQRRRSSTRSPEKGSKRPSNRLRSS